MLEKESYVKHFNVVVTTLGAAKRRYHVGMGRCDHFVSHLGFRISNDDRGDAEKN